MNSFASIALVLLGIAVLGLVWGLRWLSRPIYHRRQTIHDLPRHLRSLLNAGGHGGVLYLDHDGSRKFLQFVKRGTSEHSRYIHFGFPDADWARPFYGELEQRLADAGIKTAQRVTGDQPVPRFLIVDLLDVEHAVKVAQLAAEVLGILDGTFTVHYEGSGPSREEIGAQWQEVKRATRSRRGKEKG